MFLRYVYPSHRGESRARSQAAYDAGVASEVGRPNCLRRLRSAALAASVHARTSGRHSASTASMHLQHTAAWKVNTSLKPPPRPSGRVHTKTPAKR